MKRIFRNRTVAICAVLLALALAMTASRMFAATELDVAKLKAGMTKSSVIEVMGNPDSQGEKKGEDLCSWFTYKNVGRYKYVNIWFDCAEKLAAIDKASR